MSDTGTVTKQATLSGLAILAAAGVAIAIYILQPESESEPSPPVAAPIQKAAEFRPGPGAMRESKTVERLPIDQGVADPGAPPGLAVTPGQLLLHNKEMRNVFDYFLVGGTAADRPSRFARLQSHMKATLPASAYVEAEQIASNYMAYLTDFEKLTLNENLQKTETSSVPLNAEELEHFNARIIQLSRMRQSMLGVKIAQLWYGDEEADMQQSMLDVRQAQSSSN